MWNAGIRPTQFAFSSSIHASTELGSLASGRQLHTFSLKFGYNVELFVGSSLGDMYSKCGSLADACRIFEELPKKDEVSWTAMIDGYAKNGYFNKALLSFRNMLHDNTVVVDQYVFCSVLSACAGLKDLRIGQTVHSCIVRSGFGTDIATSNALTDMYSKTGDMESALGVVESTFNGMNVVSFSSLINGYVEMDRGEKSRYGIRGGKRRGIHPNEFTFSSLIKACANHAALELGTQFHAQVIKTSFIHEPFVGAVLVDMYGKCGLLLFSLQIFDEIPSPSNISWNSIIGAFAQHGYGRDAVEAFQQMVTRGIEPTHITFVNLLIACSHSGLIDQGLRLFNSMQETFGIEPTEQHYSCVIDMLGRAGRLKEAEEFIGRMPCEPSAFGWCSLLGSCRTHGSKELGELAGEKLMKLEPENSGTHVLLSTIYASSRQWEEVKAMRTLMRNNGLRKLPGLSWVEVEKKTHVFGPEDWSHPFKDQIYAKLEDLSERIREEGYVPFTGSLVSKVEDSEKEWLLWHHSERIAVAFALLRSPAAKPIIVKKNLRMCIDCHAAFKLIAKVEGREIIVRDNTRFHHFHCGECSCGDYW
ncbi:hypothetical protein HPP92_009634 [Vanilla planifolia]|nr:hypothetical protein HPP92_009634 [Vanilla planifolia]